MLAIAQVGLPPDEDRGRRLVALREEAKQSQTAIAEATGLSTATIRSAERGKEIGLRSLHGLADHFGVEADWIATGEGRRERGGDFFDGLTRLEEKIEDQGRALEEIRKALSEDPRWAQVEERLNFLAGRLQKVSIQAQDEDELGESPKWSPIDLSPEEPAP